MSSALAKPLVVGIAGGTGSGKTTVSKKIMSAVGRDKVALLDQDSYYRDLSHLDLEDRRKTNFDHPDAVEFELVRAHVRELVAGRSVEKPVYSFKTSTRTGEKVLVPPPEVIIVEGILALWDKKLRNLMDIKIFVETEDDIRIIRRLTRDVKERGRTLEHVIDQYLATVRPMHLTFVEPTKRYANLIIPEGGMNQVAISMVVATLNHFLTDVSAIPRTTAT
jgi:uridine kinase